MSMNLNFLFCFFLQIFFINVKGVAGSIVIFVNWFGVWVIFYIFNFLMEWSLYGIEKYNLTACFII